MNLLIDFDETIASREGKFSGAIYELLQENKFKEFTIENIRKYLKNGFPWHYAEKSHNDLFVGKSWNEYMEQFFENVFFSLINDSQKSVELSKKVIQQYLSIKKWIVFDDVIPFFDSLYSSNIDCYILSNHVPQLESLVNNLGLGKYFKKIYSSGNMNYEKPNPNFFNYVLDDIGIKNTEAIMIGDSYSADIQGAESVGVRSILVRSENKNDYKSYAKNFYQLSEKLKEMQLTTAST